MKKITSIFLCSFFAIFSMSAEQPENSTIETKAGDWFTRLRALYLLPDDHSGSVNTIPHSGVSVHPSWTGEFDFGYMFTKNLGFELILSTAKNTIVGTKSLSGTEIGTTWILPPTLLLQWRFCPTYRFQPYAGAGLNWTLFYGEDCKLPGTSLHLDQSWNAAVQLGADIFVDRSWFFNVDAKYIWMYTTAKLTGQIPGSVDVRINPWVLGAGFGRKW